MPVRKKISTEVQFSFPSLSDSPFEILNRRLGEILPLAEIMDASWQRSRKRLVNIFAQHWDHLSIAEFLSKRLELYGPDWSHLSRFRGFGGKGVIILAASFNHFKVDRINLPRDLAP